MEELKNYSLLYIEDNLDISEEVSFFLENYVNELYIAYNGEEGFAAYEKYKPDIIITDIQMPKMNGLEMIERIRKVDITTPIIVTTAFNEADYLLKAIKLHVDEYQIKPLNMKSLMRSLEKVVEPIVLRGQIKEKNEKIAQDAYYLEQFKNAVNRASIFSSSDEAGLITDVNEKFEEISGYKREEIIGRPHSILRDKDVPKELYRDMWRTIKSGEIWKGLIKNRNKNGKAYYVIAQISPIFNKDGSLKEYISIRDDVTELEEYKQFLKKELRTTNDDLDEVINYKKQYEEAINARTAIVKTDTTNTIIYVNDRFCEISGFSREEVIGKNCQEVRHSKHKIIGTCKRINNRLQDKEIVNEVLTNKKKNGEDYTVDNLFYPIVNTKGEVIEHLQVMHDLTEIVQLNEEIENTQREVVLTMGAIGETRSKETGLHVKRVAEYSYLLAKLSGLREEEASLLKQASPMHDIGKVGIADSILNKPGKLTPEEFDIMKSHAKIGYEMLKHSEREILKASATVAYTHHEKYNGKGYPNGLAGEDIHIFGRITAIADVFDALGHDRVYKKSWPMEDILSYFKQQRGEQFDPHLVDLFFQNIDKFIEIKENMCEGKINE